MKKGMSPVVAVVLLIAISIIAAISIYFWSAGLATKQPTPEKPVPIVANPVGGGKLLVANLGQKPINTSTLKTSDPDLQLVCESTTIEPGKQVLCTLKGSSSSSTTITIYGSGTSSTTLEVTEERVDNPPTISDIVDNSTEGWILLGQALHIEATVTDDIGVSSVWLNNGSADLQMTNIGDDIYAIITTPQIAGSFQYYVKANDTSDQWSQSSTKSVDVIENWMARYLYSTGNNWVYTVLTETNGYTAAGIVNGGTLFDNDALLLKIAADGQPTTGIAYGFTNGSEAGYVYQQTGGYLVFGETNTSDGHGGKDVFIIKINSSLDTTWAYLYGWTGDEEYLDVKETSTGDIVGVGTTSSFHGNTDCFMFEANPDGSLKWAKLLNTTEQERCYYIEPLSDSFIVGGDIYNSSRSAWDILLIKTDLSGNIIWAKEYTTGRLYYMTMDGDTIVLIGTRNNHIWLLLVNSTDGSIIKSNLYQTTSYDMGLGGLVEDNAYIISGESSAFGAVGDFVLLKVNKTGELKWAFRYYTSGFDMGYSVTPGIDGGYLIGGYGDTKTMLVKTGPYGDLVNCSSCENVTSAFTVTDVSSTTTTFNINMNESALPIDFATSATPSETILTITEECVCDPFGCP